MFWNLLFIFYFFFLINFASASSSASADSSTNNSVEDIKEILFEKCSICLNTLEGIFLNDPINEGPLDFHDSSDVIQLFNCKHFLHSDCFDDLMSSTLKKECPICRTVIKLEEETVDETDLLLADHEIDLLEIRCQEEANLFCDSTHATVNNRMKKTFKGRKNNFAS